MPSNNPLLVLQIDDERGPEIKIAIYFVMFLMVHLLIVMFRPYLWVIIQLLNNDFHKKYMNHDTQVQILALWDKLGVIAMKQSKLIFF